MHHRITTLAAAAVVALGLAVGLPSVAGGHEPRDADLLHEVVGTLRADVRTLKAAVAAQADQLVTARQQLSALRSDTRVNRLVEWSQTTASRLDGLEAEVDGLSGDRTCVRSNKHHIDGSEHYQWRYTIAPYHGGHNDGEPGPLRIRVRRFDCDHGAAFWFAEDTAWHPYTPTP